MNRLFPLPLRKQIENALKNESYIIGSVLANGLNTNDVENAILYETIKESCAMLYFSVGFFPKAYEIFKELKTDILSVADLFPNINLRGFSPKTDLRARCKFKKKILKGGELESAINCFIDYLSDLRMSALNKNPEDYQFIVITNLLVKCYVINNPKIIIPIMSLPNTPRLVDEFEDIFKEHQLYEELAYFYLTRQLHHKGMLIIYSSN
ncbi:Vam6/Vps39-like protein [Thelohanellus kitauei]|uniref:Vam6/Vps39-like protein n=1 Tax=Thelohanellus kitauei TaxID=669202 RepID=A0A0C2MZW4_THEKT|nr:Vam6/Vps39-like protein [Thelohanellus kitauei]